MPDRSVIRSAARPLRSALRRLGFDVVRRRAPATPAGFPVDFDAETIATIEFVGDATLTSPERMAALVEATRYVVDAGIEGAVIECGVWRGGSMMVVARTLAQLGVTDRDLYLLDTFTHMPYPGAEDVDHTGRHASEYYDEASQAEAFRYLSFDDVRANLLRTGYPAEHLHFVPGMVEQTLPHEAPDTLALVRLDTDWYESTLHELTHLWPRLSPGGVLIIDDYGHFQGCRKAVDEFFAREGLHPYLHRIDYSGRLVLKPRG